MADSAADLKFDLVVQVMLEAGYTRSILTDFLMDGLEKLKRGNKLDLQPNPSEVQTTIAEALAFNGKVGMLLPRGKPVKPNTRPKTPPPKISGALPPTPQSEEIPRGGKKRKVLADAEPNDQGLADDFASRLSIIDDESNVPESTSPCPKRLRPNPSSYLEKQLARRERERKSLYQLFEAHTWDEWQGMPGFPFSATGSGGAAAAAGAGSKVSFGPFGRFVSPQEDYGIR